MGRRFVCGFLVALFGCMAFGTTSAVSATEIGSSCEGTSATFSPVAVQTGRGGLAAFKTTAAGVVTSWRLNPASPEPRSEILKVFKQVGAEFEAVAESAPVTAMGGKPNQFPARIPVAAGVNFGLASDDAIPYCTTESEGDVFGRFDAEVPVGGKAKPAGIEDFSLLALVVVVEPDADGDGYGDETQDKCPQSATTQGTCPAPPPPASAAVKLKGKPKLEGNTVAVKLTTSAATKVTVTGSIRGKQAASPASKTVSPGETGRLYLTLKKSVKQRLANLPRKRKLKMVIEAKVAGAPTVSTEISLPGRKKPQPARAPR